VRRRISYAEAVRLLGAPEHPVLTAVDRILGGVLFGGTALGVTQLLGWFDAKAEFIKVSHQLLVKMAEKRSGLSRHDRTERIQAAHAVIVVVAFFEAVDQLKLPVSVRELGIARRQQLTLVGLTQLFDGTWPMPTPDRPYDSIAGELAFQYRDSATALLELVKAHAAWDELDETRQTRLEATVARAGSLAVEKYRELLVRAGGDYPELRFWFHLSDSQTTSRALGRIESLMSGLLVGGTPDVRRAELARKYRSVLDGPIVEADDRLPGVVIPSLRDAYVDPGFQVTPMSPNAAPAVLDWWRSVPRRDDLHRYLVGYFTSPKATELPLLVLGDPGSGKSLLTNVLAAQLPASDFLVLRVELRGTPADGDLVDQIEHGLRAALHENIGWTELARSADGTLPVIILDGFDELVQATGGRHTRYLHRAVRFQRERADLGSPVAVVVTSRIGACADVHIPFGADILRLAPFTAGQVDAWLSVWNQVNASFFAQSALSPLTPEAVLRFEGLAEQPLLLLMLALYDTIENALQRSDDTLSRSELFERLLGWFARREVTRDEADRADREVDFDTDVELDRLSVVALGMFNRGSSWLSEADLGEDLAALLEDDVRMRLAGGEAVLRRFFFVQRAEAMHDGQTLRSYEFLHVTFSEFLVARFVWRTLTSPAADENVLYSALSFMPLSSRRGVLTFLTELAAAGPPDPALPGRVAGLFAGALETRPRPVYEPVRHSQPRRQAVYALNLVLLGVVLTDPLPVADLGIADWHSLATLWKSQLSPAEWAELTNVLSLRIAPDRTMTLSIRDTSAGHAVHPQSLPGDPVFVTHDHEAHFVADPVTNLYRYALEPFVAHGWNAGQVRMVAELAVTPANRAARDRIYVRSAGNTGLVLDFLRTDQDADAGTFGKLLETPVGESAAFAALLYDRVGREPDTVAYLQVVRELWRRGADPNAAPAAVLDAWLRLSEAGVEIPASLGLPDLAGLTDALEMGAIGDVRPDLIKRVRTVLDGHVEEFVENMRQETRHIPAPRSVRPDPVPADPDWGPKLQALDEQLNRGALSPGDYRTARERVLAEAAPGPFPLAGEPPAGEPPSVQAGFSWSGQNWQESLRELDGELTAGNISADEYLTRRDRILSDVVGPGAETVRWGQAQVE
jgi:hypothetical protein